MGGSSRCSFQAGFAYYYIALGTYTYMALICMFHVQDTVTYDIYDTQLDPECLQVLVTRLRQLVIKAGSS